MDDSREQEKPEDTLDSGEEAIREVARMSGLTVDEVMELRAMMGVDDV